jgi:multidrug efflux pump subunit AcrA (membrane-fusion protein)
MKMRRLLTILICCVLLAAGCGNAETQEVPELLTPVGKSVSETEAVRKDLYNISVYNGEVLADIKEYSFGISGRVSGVYKKMGDRVYPGDLLADMDSASAQAAVSEVLDKINEIKSSCNYEIEKLRKENSDPKITWQEKEMNDLKISQQKQVLDEAVSKLDEMLENAREKLASTSVYAEEGGEVIAVASNSGRWVGGNTNIMAVANSEKKFIVCDYIDDETFGKANEVYTLLGGKKIALTRINSFPEEEPVYTRFSVPDESLFYIGDYAPVIILSDLTENVLTVPKDALYSDAAGKYVYAVTEGNRTKTYVTLGIEGLNDYEILEGLKEGDKVFLKDDTTASARSSMTKRGDFVITTRAKASSNYSTQTTLTADRTYGTLVFKGFNFTTFEPIKKGEIIASYFEAVEPDYVAETRFSLKLALLQKDYERIAELENTLEDLEEAMTSRNVTAPYDGMLIATERIYKGSGISNGRIGTFASTENLLLTVDNSSNAFRYGQTVTVEAVVNGETVKGTGRIISASRTGLMGNYNTSTAYVKVDEEWEYLCFGASRFVSTDNIVVEDVILVPVDGVTTYNGNLTVLSREDGKLKRLRFVNGRKGSDYYWAADGVGEGLNIYYE